MKSYLNGKGASGVCIFLIILGNLVKCDAYKVIYQSSYPSRSYLGVKNSEYVIAFLED